MMTTHAYTPVPTAPIRCADCCGAVDDAEYLDVPPNMLAHSECVVECATCGEYTLRRSSDWATDADGVLVRLCAACIVTQAFTCDDCGNVCLDVAWGSDGVCATCERVRQEEAERAQRVIGPYHNSDRRACMSPITSAWALSHGLRYFGVELECEMQGDAFDDNERQDTARALLDVANVGMRRAWAEHDGSLNWGFELITQPMGLDGHAEMWPRVLSHPAARALRSHDTRTCGLHVHVSRRGLTQLQIARAVVFLNAPENETLVRAIARRYGNSYCRIAKKTLNSACGSFDRYEMLNLTNSRTVEFRLFRGTLRAETVLACVEFSNAVLEFARTASNNALNTYAFLAHVYDPANASDTKNLRRFFARRVTERAAPRYEPLKATIESLTKRAIRAPRVTDTTTRWAEI